LGGGFICLFFLIFGSSGYPRLLSGDLKDLTKVYEKHQTSLFPGAAKDSPWNDMTQFKRYFMSFPFYPFRTLCPRDLASLKINSHQHEFDSSSPVVPANTQINFVFTKRNKDKLLNYLLPYNLNMELGTSANQLADEDRKLALTFSRMEPAAAGVAGAAGVTRKSYVIKDVEIVINTMYLQVKNSPFYFVLSFFLPQFSTSD